MKIHQNWDGVLYIEHKARLYGLETPWRAGAWRLWVFEEGITYDDLYNDPDLEPSEVHDPHLLELFVNSARLLNL